jgi:hypothetical protein
MKKSKEKYADCVDADIAKQDDEFEKHIKKHNSEFVSRVFANRRE